MTKIELIQQIIAEVCEDCGEEPVDCFRVIEAIAMLDKFLAEGIQKCAV